MPGWHHLPEHVAWPRPHAPTLSLSCWQSCRETVKKTRASLSHGITDSTLCTWLTSRRWEPHSLRGEGRVPETPASEVQCAGVQRVLQGSPPRSILTTWPPGCGARSLQLGGSSRQKSTRPSQALGAAGHRPMGTGMGDRGGEGPVYLGGIGLQGVQLVHGEAELVEVDIHIDQQVRGQGRGKHPLWGRQGGRQDERWADTSPQEPPRGIPAPILWTGASRLPRCLR